MERGFYVTVSSNGSTKYFPNNTVRHFSNHLAEPILFEDEKDWEVGLTEITMPPLSNHMKFNREDMRVHITYKTFIEKDGKKIDHRISDELQLRGFSDAKTFVGMFRKQLEADVKVDAIKKVIKMYQPFGRNILIFGLDQNLFLTFSLKVWNALGFEGDVNHTHRMIGSPDHSVKVYSRVDLRSAYRSCWVYSNCCAHRLVADVRVPLLRTISLHENDDEMIHRIFTVPYYLPINQNFLPNIEIVITDNTGHACVHFPGETVATLHFRRRGERRLESTV